MTMDRIATSALALALAALSSAPLAADAPGYFKVPGTDTTVKIYGYAVLDAFYDAQPGIGNWGTIVDAIKDAQAAGNVDAWAPKNQWTMSANRSRFGFTTTSPSSFGDVNVKIEGDFLPGTFRLRHGYGTIGNVLAGKTWSTFMDLDATPETVDFTGPIGNANFDTPRYPQLRYTIPFTKQVSLALAIEQDTTGSNDSQFPGAVVGALTYADDWGHVAGRVLYQNYAHFIAQTPTTPEYKYNKTAIAWQLSGNMMFGKDNLMVDIVSGDGLGAYGAGIQAAKNDLTNHQMNVYSSTGMTIGYAHVWTDSVRSNISASQLKYKSDSFTAPSDIETIRNLFLNTFITFAKNSELGLEYVYGEAKAFDSNGLKNADGSPADTIKESRFQMALQFNFF